MGKAKDIGEIIKTRRQEMNLTLKEVENVTSIRMNHLRAIEEGEIEELISSVYAQGFVKQYAAFLGLDGEDFNQVYSKDLEASQDFAYGIGTLEVRGSAGHNVKWLPNGLWLGATTVIILAALLFARYLEVI